MGAGGQLEAAEPSWPRGRKKDSFSPFTTLRDQSMGGNQANAVLKPQPSHLPLLHELEQQGEGEKREQKGFWGWNC